MAKIPNAQMVDDVATRFEVPIGCDDVSGSVITVASIFETLSTENDFPEFTIGKSSLETAFIRIINENEGRDYGDGENMSSRRVKIWGLC